MPSFFVKDNVNVESKNENESGIQDESHKCGKISWIIYLIHENTILIKLLCLILR